MTAPAAMMEPSPMRAPLRMTAPMPMRQASSTTQPWTVALWPMVTISPTWTPYLWRWPWSTAQSCTLVLGPMRMALTSPRTTAFIQTLACSPSTTSPMSWAETST